MEQQNSLTPQTSTEFSAVVTSMPAFLSSLPEPLSRAWRNAEMVMCVEEVVSLPDEPKIAKLQSVSEPLTYKSIGRMLARMVVEQHIADGLSTVNIKNIAKRLTTDKEIKWWLTLADVDLLCRRIAQGYYGKFYGHFSEGEFYDCFVKYCNERRDAHRVNAENATSQPDASVLADVGYTIEKDGKLNVSKVMPAVKPKPPRYLYDAKGNIIGENPKYWDQFKRNDRITESQLQHINRMNKIQEETIKIMKSEDIPYIQAYEKAVQKIKNENQGSN